MTTLAITFLAPLAGTIAASISFPILLTLYFLKLRRRPIRISSTLLWRHAAADLQVNVPFRWIRPSWILVLQLLVLGLLCAALARPALDESPAPTGTILLLIDRSASMSAIDGAPAGALAQRSRLEQAKADASEFVSRLGDRARAMVVAFGARPEALTNLTRDRGLLRGAIASIQPSDEPGDMMELARFVAAARNIEQGEERVSVRAVLFGDGGGQGGAPITVPGLGDVQFDFVRAGPAPEALRDNVGIVALAAKRDYESPNTLRVFARIQSTLNEPLQAALACRLDADDVQARAVTVPPMLAGGPAGEAGVTFEFPAPHGGLITVSLAREDALASDDTAAAIVRPPGAPRILLVQPNVPTSLVDYLPYDALASLEPRELKTVTAGAYETMAAARGSDSAAAFDLIVFDRVRPSAPPPAPSVSFAAGVPVPGLRVEQFEENEAAGASTMFAFWQRSHPVMRYVNLSGVAVRRPMRLVIPDPEARAPEAQRGTAASSPPQSTVLASGASGPLIALVEHAGLRRIIVGFELAQSRWWQDPSFPVFLKNATDFLTDTGEDSTARVLTTAQSISVRPLPAATRLSIEGPVAFEREVPLAGERIVLGRLPRVGLYRIAGAMTDDAVLPVNLLDAEESVIRTVDRLNIAGQGIASTSLSAMAPREIWPWLVLAAAVLLAIEWIVFVSRIRT